MRSTNDAKQWRAILGQFDGTAGSEAMLQKELSHQPFNIMPLWLVAC